MGGGDLLEARGGGFEPVKGVGERGGHGQVLPMNYMQCLTRFRAVEQRGSTSLLFRLDLQTPELQHGSVSWPETYR
jgi:hypothetical protein